MSKSGLQGRRALVVGGANGLGREIARVYSREGVRLVIADLDVENAARTVELCGQREPVHALAVDLGDPVAAGAVVERAVGLLGGLDVLVNCAAISLVDPLLELTPERYDRVFDINARGAFFLMQAAAKVMVSRGFGRIIQISTPASKSGFPLWATYGASRAALDNFVKAAAIELAPHGVTVNTIVPGRMTGGMITSLDAAVARITGRGGPEVEEERTQSLPMRRRVPPSEVAEAAVWLASDAAAYVTAERFNFTGGMEQQ